MIASALPLLAGRMQSDSRLRVGWFHQHQIEALDPVDTPLVIIRRLRPDDSESSRRSRLAQFGLGFEKQETTVADLSGGERARLLLNLIAMEAPHLPDSRQSRPIILTSTAGGRCSRRSTDYEGAVILVTHDRALMELVADRLWLVADGQ